MKHRHHITPTHRDPSPSNNSTVEVSITRHAMFHFAEWQLWGLKEDFLAWRGLAGLSTKEELAEELMILGRAKGKQGREKAIREMFENGTHPFLSRELIEERKTINAKCLTDYNTSTQGRETARSTAIKTNSRKEKCPQCNYTNNPGNLSKHIKIHHPEGKT